MASSSFDYLLIDRFNCCGELAQREHAFDGGLALRWFPSAGALGVDQVGFPDVVLADSQHGRESLHERSAVLALDRPGLQPADPAQPSRSGQAAPRRARTWR